jgi:3-dehydroquinate synthase
LNFGHTFGHAIENSLGYGEWLHGEAVAAGMVMATELSGLGDKDLKRIKDLLAAAGLPVAPPEIDARRWLEAMGMDKKVTDKKLRFVLLKSLGDACVSSSFDRQRLQQLIGATAG